MHCLVLLRCLSLIGGRFVNIGSRSRPLSSGEFGANELLPCDTNCWDNGKLAPSQPLFITSATQLKVDPFARTCQVAHLLGRVIGHRDDRIFNDSFRFTTAIQLHKTLNSLIKLLQKEFTLDSIAFRTPLSLAFSAKMLFLDMYACSATNRGVNCAEEIELQGSAIEDLPRVVTEIAHFA